MENLTPSTKTVRVSYCDPDATDSSSDEGSGKSHKRKVHEIELQFVQKKHDPRSDSGDVLEETGFKKPNMTSEGERMVGVTQTRSGKKFWAEVRDPIKGRLVWRGVFGTAEAASTAYLSRESNLAATKLTAGQRIESAGSQNPHLVVLDRHSPPTSVRKKIEGVLMTKSGKFRASVSDPFKRKQVYLGSFATAEEASRAYVAKKAQLEADKLRVEELQFEAKMLRDKRRIDRLASGKSTLQDSASSVLRNGPSDLTSFQGVARTRASYIRRTRHGKFSAETTDPITKRRVYIATFATEEEAYSASLAKEAEFAAEMLRANRKIDGVASGFQDSVSSLLGNDTLDLTSFQEGARTRISDGRRRNSCNFSAEITEPIITTRDWIDTSAPVESASRAYPTQESKFVEVEKLRATQAASQNPPFQDMIPQTIARKKKEGGVWRWKSGKFGATVRDPFKKKFVSLGSFTTAEEASRAYLAKKAQLEAKQLRIQKSQLEAKMLRAKQRMERVASGKSTFHGGARTRISGVYRTNSRKYSVTIEHPITKGRVSVGTFASKQKACRAYRAKEAEFEEELKAKQPFERVASENSLARDSSSVVEILTSYLSNETGVDESVGGNNVMGDQEAGFGFFNGVQVVDKNGFLVGEFSVLDDFSICS